jgi:RNA polymerase sigma factor (sigma-70 family)
MEHPVDPTCGLTDRQIVPEARICPLALSIQPSGESVIIAALRSGDLRRAVELLLETYQDEVFSYCGRLLGGGGALEAYRRVLSAAIADLTARRHETSLRAWLFAIARNVVIHQHQLQRGHYPRALSPGYVPLAASPETAGLIAPDPELMQALAQLEPAAQEVLQLALWHDLTLVEIGEVIGCSPRVVRRLAARGLLQISHQLPRQQGDPS